MLLFMTRESAVRRWSLWGVLLCLLAILVWQTTRSVSSTARPPLQSVPPRQPRFDLSRVSIPRQQILAGGPPVDGIPALTAPQTVSAEAASFLRADDRVIGLQVEGAARAYPISILVYHELVNDMLGERPVLITYCPLCDSVAAFDRQTPLGVREFGVSGLLYNSNVLMYDRGGQPESLWSQLAGEGVTGPAMGQPLNWLPVELTTWSDWRTRHPLTDVLSTETGYPRNYDEFPYPGYFEEPETIFPTQPWSDALPAKQRLLGVWTDQQARAYPIEILERDVEPIEDQLAGARFTIHAGRITAADAAVRWVYCLWFSWYAFHPETELYGEGAHVSRE